MNDDLLTFLVLAPGWLTGLALLLAGSRTRGLSRPLWNGERTVGTVVAHEVWRAAGGRERVGIVVDFLDRAGNRGRLVEPPVRWERPPAVGTRVSISYRPDDLGFAKRYSRRHQAAGWLATLVSMPLVVLFLVSFPLWMGVVIVPQVAWLALRRWWPAAGPIRQPTDLCAVGDAGFDPTAMVVPTSPPSLEATVDGADPVIEGPRTTIDPALVLRSVRRLFYPLASGAVILVVALIGASRSSDQHAVGWHLGLATVLGIGLVLFESSLAHRGGTVMTGTVVDHVHRRDAEGDVYWWEVVEISTGDSVVSFVDTMAPRRQRPIGSPVAVSFRRGEPDRLRSLHRSQSMLGTVMIAGAVGIGLYLFAPTWMPVLIQTAVCYLGYVVLDVVRGLSTVTPALEPS